MDLFAEQREAAVRSVRPVAVRMRPDTLDAFVGQEHFIGPGKLLRRMLEADRLTSAIFYGPPGTGKTTLAHIIAAHTKASFEQVTAAGVGVKEVREILARARDRLETAGQRTVLFIDELHRFNRAQQDVLLRDVEDGIVILIGATTENPFFAVNAPLVSRSQIFQFEKLTDEHVMTLLRRALADADCGLGCHGVEVTEEALRHLAVTSDGDARRALTALEVAVQSTAADALGSRTSTKEGGARRDSRTSSSGVVDLAAAEDSIQRKAIEYDAGGDAHYDAASALIKSMRGSDPDATVYWLARMLEAGEDPRFVARRIAICAAEDVGNADPQALVLAAAAARVTELVGMPECQLPLAQAALYIACAEKSNAAAQAIWQAAADVREQRTVPVPKPLRDAHYGGARRLGHGTEYTYPHDAASGFVEQVYLGVDRLYYEPTGRGHEATLAAYLARVRGEGGQPETKSQGSRNHRGKEGSAREAATGSGGD